MTALRILHFADAHIDMANFGRHDPETGLPVRVMDFLTALDAIIDGAIEEQVDLVLFAGDAYKDRNPHPTFQREWGRRIMRLSAAGIPTVLLVGNHDVSPASGRAHTIQEFDTLGVPHVHVADRITRLEPAQLGVPVQIVTIPWVSRSALMTREETSGLSLDDVLIQIEERVTGAIEQLVANADPDLPLILLAHVSVAGATWGSERTVMLGHEMVLGRRVVTDKRLDYVALGHIHKHQSLNDAEHPPVIYPGSIERIDFGEWREKKGYVLATVERGQTDWRFISLPTRRFLEFSVTPDSMETFMADVMAQLPAPESVTDAICRLRLTYPNEWETMLDEAALYEHFASAFSLQLQKLRQMERRARLGDTVSVETLGPLELLDLYWRNQGVDPDEAQALQALAQSVLADQEVDDSS